MPADIALAASGLPIKNGTIVTSATEAGQYSTNNNSVSNLPSIIDIATKYDERFDDPDYYYGT